MKNSTATETDLRSHKALAALEHSGQWLRVRNSEGAALAYGIPSATTTGLYHFATATECTCKDHEYGNRCWHSRAVAMHHELTHAQQQPKATTQPDGPRCQNCPRPAIHSVVFEDWRRTRNGGMQASGWYPICEECRPREEQRLRRLPANHIDLNFYRPTRPLPPITDAQAARIMGRL